MHQYGDKESMPAKAMGLANVIVTGIWQYNIFMGREWEIEHCFQSVPLFIEPLCRLDTKVLPRNLNSHSKLFA